MRARGEEGAARVEALLTEIEEAVAKLRHELRRSDQPARGRDNGSRS
jgi:hypothetical protein